MVLGDFLAPVVMSLVVLVIGFFVRPHWKSFDPATKFVVGFIPGLLCFAWSMLLIGVLIGFDTY